MSIQKKMRESWVTVQGRIRKLKLAKNEILSGGTGIEVNLLLLAHSLEKGMGLPNPRARFGLKKAVSCLDLLEQYQKEGKDINRYAYIESLSVLETYFHFTDNDCMEYVDRIKKIKAQVKNLYPAGYEEIGSMKAIYDKLDFEQIEYFIRSRHSIRSYEPVAVDEEIIHSVLRLASCAPSACNRQPVKVYWTPEPDKVKQLNKLVPGNQGFEEEIPNWAIATVDRKMFGAAETLQWYVNGGIYLSYLVEAFHAYKLGSCIFQLPTTYQCTADIKRLIGASSGEAIIAAVGFGVPREKNKFLVASRRPVVETLVKF